MTRYQLAKLISMAPGHTLESRKRVQKIVFLLTAAGMELAEDYRLHHYGPYSREVAKLLDELSSLAILQEVENTSGSRKQFNYSLTASGLASLGELESDLPKSMRRQQKQFDEHRDKILALLQVDDPWLLELGATIAFFHRRGSEWGEATSLACEFKKVAVDSAKSRRALLLAKQIVD